MTDRPEGRTLSEQSRRYNAMIADAVMRAEAEGKRVVPSSAGVGDDCMCPMGAVIRSGPAYPRFVSAALIEKLGASPDWVGFFVLGFEGFEPTRDEEAHYLGRCYRARALRMHGGGE